MGAPVGALILAPQEGCRLRAALDGATSADVIPDHIGAVATKIARVLALKPQCFITHPAELSVLKAMSSDELRDFAESRGWRKVYRVGGRQIEFYKDVTVRADEAGRY
jgi:hypothetical protein